MTTWKFVPVDGIDNAFYIIANDREDGCYRFLSSSAGCTNDNVMLSIADNGEGLEEWIIEEAFAAPVLLTARPMTASSAIVSFEPSPQSVKCTVYAKNMETSEIISKDVDVDKELQSAILTGLSTSTNYSIYATCIAKDGMESPTSNSISIFTDTEIPVITSAAAVGPTDARVTFKPSVSATSCTVTLEQHPARPRGNDEKVLSPVSYPSSYVDFEKLNPLRNYTAFVVCQIGEQSEEKRSDNVEFLTPGSEAKPPTTTYNECDGEGELVKSNGECVCDIMNSRGQGFYFPTGYGGCKQWSGVGVDPVYQRCDGELVDVMRSYQNCGKCNNVCDVGRILDLYFQILNLYGYDDVEDDISEYLDQLVCIDGVCIDYGDPDLPNICFPAEATVRLDDGRLKRMDDLAIGDLVQTVDEAGAIVSSPVYVMAHAEKSGMYQFMRITTSSSHNLIISPKHYIYVADEEHPGEWSNRISIPAGKIKVGDQVWVVSDKNVSTNISHVVRVEKIFKEGIFSPLTLTGSIVVDDVAASVYSNMLGKESVMHILCSVGRVLWNVFPGFCHWMHARGWASPVSMGIAHLAKYVLDMASFLAW